MYNASEQEKNTRFKSLDFPDDREWTINYGYSRFVRFFRKFMVLIALGLIGAVAIWLLYPKPGQNIKPPPQAGPRGETALVKPQFDGIDSENRPYRVTADAALRSTDNTDLIEMTKPLADIFSADKHWLAASAETGVFNQAGSVLKLEGNVHFFYDEGMEFTLDRAVIDLKNSKAHSTLPVKGQGPAGRITAQGLKISDAGNHVVFTGPATLRMQAAE